jgi:hypothetical protein
MKQVEQIARPLCVSRSRTGQESRAAFRHKSVTALIIPQSAGGAKAPLVVCNLQISPHHAVWSAHRRRKIKIPNSSNLFSPQGQREGVWKFN